MVDVRDYTDMVILGATRDDAAGECFDKTARVLGLPYPGGKPIDDLSRTGDDGRYGFPVSRVDGNPYDMSFSGLKTAVINLVHNAEQKGEELDRASLAASFTKAVSDSLVPRTLQAARMLGYDKIAVAGGVAANSRIRADFKAAAEKAGAQLFVPPLKLCGDNAAMSSSRYSMPLNSGRNRYRRKQKIQVSRKTRCLTTLTAYLPATASRQIMKNISRATRPGWRTQDFRGHGDVGVGFVLKRCQTVVAQVAGGDKGAVTVVEQCAHGGLQIGNGM